MLKAYTASSTNLDADALGSERSLSVELSLRYCAALALQPYMVSEGS